MEKEQVRIYLSKENIKLDITNVMDFDELLERLIYRKKVFEDHYSLYDKFEVEFEERNDSGNSYQYEDYPAELLFFGIREETDEERKERIEKEKKAKEEKIEDEKRQLEIKINNIKKEAEKYGYKIELGKK